MDLRSAARARAVGPHAADRDIGRLIPAWLDAGLRPRRIAVNLSGLQFKTPGALEAGITAALTETGFPAGMLELELTESTLMDVSREHSDALMRLHEAGITIAIDDFGTGYCSLNYLRRFRVDRIKIAETFVQHLETMSGDVAIVKATIGLARELGINVIAEGVETPEQLNLLRGWGCGEGEIQGFYFAKPLAADAVTVLLRDGGVLPHVKLEGTPPLPPISTSNVRSKGVSARLRPWRS